jgi:hypothetical protein
MTKHSISIASMKFNPSAISVLAGDTVVWTNNDTSIHTVTDDAGGIGVPVDSNDIAAGATYERVYEVAGDYPYHCDKHPSMKGSVTVTGSLIKMDEAKVLEAAHKLAEAGAALEEARAKCAEAHAAFEAVEEERNKAQVVYDEAKLALIELCKSDEKASEKKAKKKAHH